MKKSLKYNLNYTDFKRYKEKFFSKISKRCGLFFAFGKEQFNQALEKNRLTVDDIVSIGCGGYLPKSRITLYKQLMDKYDALNDSYFNSLHNNKNHKEILKTAVRYELGNYEYGYTRDSYTLENVYYMTKFNRNKKNDKIFFEAVREYLNWSDEVN